VTHHGSSPGRPRGRRARPDNGPDYGPDDGPGYGPGNGVPEWTGHDTVPRSDGWDGPEQQPPWETQRPAQAQVPAPDRVPAPASALQAPARAPRSSEEPDWSDPVSVEAFSERWNRRGSESRGDRRADRRKRRRRYYLIGGGAAAVVAIAVAVYFLTGSSGKPSNVGIVPLVTSFLPGEIQQVPDACSTVPAATLSQYLPGQPKMAAPPLNSGASSQCTWTLDNPPTYRVLEVILQAYAPSGLASGDGSATFAAIDAYAEDEQGMQHPGPDSGQPKATVTDLSGMPGGSDTVAFSAMQVFNRDGAITDVATVTVRYRNVIVTVVLNGLEHGNKGNYGPVSQSALSSAAQTVAQQVTAKITH
jgi:hypothetical protein